jgi:hypothetical protein
MTAHPFTIAAARRRAVPAPRDRYIVEFRLETTTGATDWYLPPAEHLPESMEDVLWQIAEHHPLETTNRCVTLADGLGLMRVTKLCADTERHRDVTEDVARAFGHWRVVRGGDWPQWARDADDREAV